MKGQDRDQEIYHGLGAIVPMARYPIETAEFAFSRGIDDEPAFNWWVGWVLKKRANIIVKSRHDRLGTRDTV
jgi:hypothetical protein